MKLQRMTSLVEINMYEYTVKRVLHTLQNFNERKEQSGAVFLYITVGLYMKTEC
jgi:hypothetical protein